MAWNVGAGLEGKGVLVTGAAGGIGKSVAEAFGATGARVMAVDLDQGAVEAVVAGLPGGGHLAVGANLRDLGALTGLVGRARQELGSLDVLVHLAAVLRRRLNIDEVTEEDWDFQIDLNFKSTFFLARAAAGAMRDQGRGGRVILFSSQGWWTGGLGGSVVYNAAKGGVVTMARGLSRIYGPHGITVNTVAPSFVITPMLMSGLDPTMLESWKTATPLGRLADPGEIAGPVVFLASDHASFISGTTLNISGGFLNY
ncbi:MAG: short-chain dehydrogenase/reductase [Chloroflexi bacterium]|nr:short-chain dehydrogenase/reductase [Chloroflexota bacterium]